MLAGGCAKGSEEEPTGDEAGQPLLHGAGICKWFNVRMGFGFLSMTTKEGIALDSPVDVFVHQGFLYDCLFFSFIGKNIELHIIDMFHGLS
uniref:Protein lin-28 A n=1 Tax=Sphaerodactylus townsendi TaxID=933632 RepID=A0ACB8FRS0_9SAUR